MATLIINYGRDNDYATMLPELAAETAIFTHHPLPQPERYAHYEVVHGCEQAAYPELRAYELGESMPFRRVLTDNEYDLVRVGRLREHFGTTGQTAADALAFRDKVLMKDLVGRAVAVPAFARIEHIADLCAFVSDHGYPVIVKPVDQGGSRDVRLLRDYEELTALSRLPWTGDLMVEEFVDGTMYHVDAVIAPGFQFKAVSRYHNSCLGFLSGASLGSVQLQPGEGMARRLEAVFEQVLSALPAPEVGAYHLEVFHTPGDRLVFCEVAARVGGARIPALLRHTYGIDVKETWFRLSCGLDLRRKPDPSPSWVHADIALAPRAGTLVAVPERPPFPWVVDYAATTATGQTIGPAEHSGASLCVATVRGVDSRQLLKRVKTCEQWLAERVVLGEPGDQIVEDAVCATA